MGRIYYVQANNLAVTTTGDFMQLRAGAARLTKIHEITVWQESDVALAMNTIRLHRGVGGATGSALTERQNDITDAAPLAAAFSLPGTPVGTLDMDIHRGWNILQEFVWLPTPRIQLELAASDHLGISLRVADTLTIGCGIWFEEVGN